MRISGSRRYQYEERIAHKSKQGKLTAETIREAVERLDNMSAKLTALMAKMEKWRTMDPPPSQQTTDSVMNRADTLSWRCRTLSAVPEINAAILKREAASK